MKKKISLEICCFLFVLLFLYTALSKLMTFSFYLADLKESPILGNYSTFIAYTVPVWEIIVATGLLIGITRRVSLYLFLYTMVAFTLYISYMLLFSDHRPCTCGGVVRELSWPQHLVFNIAFIIMAIGAIIWDKQLNKQNRQRHVIAYG